MAKNTSDDVTFTKGEAVKILPEAYRAQMLTEGWSVAGEEKPVGKKGTAKTDLASQLAAAGGKKAAECDAE